MLRFSFLLLLLSFPHSLAFPSHLRSPIPFPLKLPLSFSPIPSKWHLPLLLFLPFHFFFSTSFSDFSFSFPLPTSFFPFSLPHAVPSFHFPFHLLPHLYFFSLLLFTYHGLSSWPLSRIKQSAWEIREVHDLLSLPLSLLLSFPHVTFNYSLWYTNHYSAFPQTQRADS